MSDDIRTRLKTSIDSYRTGTKQKKDAQEAEKQRVAHSKTSFMKDVVQPALETIKAALTHAAITSHISGDTYERTLIANSSPDFPSMSFVFQTDHTNGQDQLTFRWSIDGTQQSVELLPTNAPFSSIPKEFLENRIVKEITEGLARELAKK